MGSVPSKGVRVKWWLPNGLPKEATKGLKKHLQETVLKDLQCGACQKAIELKDDVFIAAQLIRTDNGFTVFPTHPLCAAPRIRVAPSDVPYTQGDMSQRRISYQPGIGPNGGAILLIDIGGSVHGLPPRHRNAISATRIYAEARSLTIVTDANTDRLGRVCAASTTLRIGGHRGFIVRDRVGILDELDLSTAGASWWDAAKRNDEVTVIASVGILREGLEKSDGTIPILAHSTIKTRWMGDDFIAPYESTDQSVYKILNIAPGASPSVFMLDSDVTIGIENWFYGKGGSPTGTTRRQLASLLTVRSLMGPMHVDYTLGVAEICWGRYSAPIDEAHIRRITRAVHAISEMDTGTLLELANSTKPPSDALKVKDPFPISMPERETALQLMSYALTLRLQILHRDSRRANNERKLRLFSEFIDDIEGDLKFIGAYELQVACDILFAKAQGGSYCDLLLKPTKKAELLKNSWGAAWDLTHMRRADLALRGIHRDVPAVAALVSGDKALRLLRDRLTVHSQADVRGSSVLQMNLSMANFARQQEESRFKEIIERANSLIDTSIGTPVEQNLENAQRSTGRYRQILTS
nr:hypothetical protein OG409_25900 [Streptomyces sp. NBC_00974]